MGRICQLQDKAWGAAPQVKSPRHAVFIVFFLTDENMLSRGLNLLQAPHRHVPDQGVWLLGRFLHA